MEIGPQSRTVSRDRKPAGCTIAGLASDLYLLLQNRRDRAGIRVDGDSGVLNLFRDKAQVTGM
jgi:hypothetical protein